ncbi:UNVERIFIED_CONTAM: hypothetical protein FKN15_034807 [Acipenser sinensis]
MAVELRAAHSLPPLLGTDAAVPSAALLRSWGTGAALLLTLETQGYRPPNHATDRLLLTVLLTLYTVFKRDQEQSTQKEYLKLQA